MIKPDLIVRSYRKTLCINITKQGELVVRAPRSLSLEYIMQFVKDKEKWILKKKKEMLENSNKNSSIINYNTFLYYGKEYKKMDFSGIKSVEISKGSIVFPNHLTKSEMLYLAQDFYITQTKELLKLRLNYFAELMNLTYTSVSIINSKTRWGSCSAEGELKFNLRISMLPCKIIDYIIIHELAHLIEFNHSKKFYKIIACVMPKWESVRKELKSYDYLLNLIR